MMFSAVTVSSVMLISRNLHQDTKKINSTRCTASKMLMQDSLAEVEISLLEDFHQIKCRRFTNTIMVHFS